MTEEKKDFYSSSIRLGYLVPAACTLDACIYDACMYDACMYDPCMIHKCMMHRFLILIPDPDTCMHL